MLQKTLSSFTNILSDYLKLSFKLMNDIVLLHQISDVDKSSMTNKVIVSLVNVERETAGGIPFSYSAVNTSHYKKTKPAWQLNLYVLIASFFSGKQYEEGLQLLSGVIHFLQTNNVILLPDTDINVSIEPVNLTFNELSNLWSVCGSTYYPSILCKLRVIHVDGSEIKKVVTAVKKEDVKL